MYCSTQAVTAPTPRRRVTDLSHSHAAPRVRTLCQPPHSDRMEGWVAASMSRALPADANPEYTAGFREGQSYFLSIRDADEASLQVLA